MLLNTHTRREFSARLASFISAMGIAGTALAATGSGNAEGREIPRPRRARNDGVPEELSHTAESIHQEVVFKASRKRVYEALTDAKQFTKVTEFSMVKNASAAEISREVGGAFALFGGYVTGRHIELVPDERIVQAWRAGSWDAGDYSIAKFVFKEQGTDTKLGFDHTGFPSGAGEHLAEGWKINYWEPLQKYLGSST
jgi:activator of HSP90 ATPase